MTHDDKSSDSQPVAMKKTGLDLGMVLQSCATVPTSVGTVYLYGLRVSDLSTFHSLQDREPIARIRAFLPHIASLVDANGLADERPALDTSSVDQLSDAEVETIAEIYAAKGLRGPRIVDEEAEALERKTKEPSVAYLNRLLQHEAEAQSTQLRRMREQILASNSNLFDQVRKSSSILESTVKEFEKLNVLSPAFKIDQKQRDSFHADTERLVRQMRERAEELEMVRLTGKMTAESARTLKDLAEAATILLEQLDERDKRADRSTRKQITIAVWSVGISAVLALFALVFSSLAYFQDKSNNATGERWQSALMVAVRDGSRERDAAARDAQRLRDQVATLEAKIARIESTQDPDLPAKGTEPATHRATGPVSPVESQ